MGRHGSASGSFTTYAAYATFGELLKVLRRRAHLTQRDLGVVVGYSETYITRLESNERRPDPTTVSARFIAALDLTHDPELARRLIELAELAVSESEPGPAIPAPSAPHVTNLPASLTRFIGREHEIAEVVRLLTTTRLLTLTGSGGVGKTRLAIVAGALLNSTAAYTDGVWLVELAPLTDSGPLISTVVAAFGLQTMSRPARAVLTDYLLDREALLILDNCEHLIQACAELAETLLRACWRLRILVTSREGLNIPGEVTWRVPPLAEEEAVQLFAERASAAKPGLTLTAANRNYVERICRRLDDMPLAIELAAARVRVFTVEQLATRMDDVFRLLTGGSRTALPRHQTLRATIDWSYGLLSEHERALLRGLSVFVGGWTLEAIEAIHGAGALEPLEQLVNKSLVVVDADEAAGGARYQLLETIRQYASEAAQHADVDELTPIRQRHLIYYANLAQIGQASPEPGIWHWIWNSVVAAELDNTRAALNWAAQSGNWERGWQLIRGVLGVWVMLGYADELRQWAHTIVLSNLAASDIARGSILATMGRMQYDKGDAIGGLECYRAASQLAHQLGDDELQLEADQYLGFLTPDDRESNELLEGVIQLAHRTGRRNREAWARSMLGARLRMQGQRHQASDILTAGIGLAREAGDVGILAASLVYLYQLHLDQGDLVNARAVLEESIALCRQRGVQGTLGVNLCNLAEIGLRLGDYALTRVALKEHLPLHHRMDYLERVAHGFVTAAGLAQIQCQLVQAVRLLAAAQAIRRDHHSLGIFEGELFAEYNRRLPAVRAELDPAAFERAWAEGQRLTLNQAIQEALAV